MNQNNMNSKNNKKEDSEATINAESKSIDNDLEETQKETEDNSLISHEDENEEKIDSENKEKEDSNLDEQTFWTKKKILIIVIIMALIIPGAAIGSSYFLSRIQSKNEAQSALESISQQKGDIEVTNTKLTTFKGQKISSANIDQKALTSASDVGSDSAVFAFSNGKTSKDKKVIDVYLDFGSQKSRDFILLNQSSLKNMVENNLIDLRIHPVPSASSFSVYAAEAVSESIVTNPDKTWDFIIELLKTSANLKTDKNDDIIKAVLKTTKDQRIEDIDKESLTNGTFASWILSVGDDPKIKTGYYPPIIYINEKIVDPDEVFLNDSSAFQKYVINEEKN